MNFKTRVLQFHQTITSGHLMVFLSMNTGNSHNNDIIKCTLILIMEFTLGREVITAEKLCH